MANLDFKGLNSFLLRDAARFLMDLLPGGELRGNEYVCAGVDGGAGGSMSVNIKSGVWKDFATGETGGDLISVAAASMGVDQGSAYKWAADTYGYKSNNNVNGSRVTVPGPAVELIAPPSGKVPPVKGPSWAYKDRDGNALFYVERIDGPTGKSFCPWSWSKSSDNWVKKSWSAPRPLYGLELLAQFPDKPVLVVEGEGKCEAARKFISAYVVIGWSNGASAVNKTDWSPLFGRAKVVMWPDADEPGITAMNTLGGHLFGQVGELKVLDVTGMPEGWDAADAAKEGFNYKKWIEWAAPRAKLLNQPEPSVVLEPEDRSDWGLAWTGGNNPKIHCNESNVSIILEKSREFSGRFWYDRFHNRLFSTWKSKEPYYLKDEHFIGILFRLQSEYEMPGLKLSVVQNAVVCVSYSLEKNEVREWLDALKWDGVSRIDSLLVDCFGAEDSEYTRSVSANILKSLTARILYPGCKVDNMAILEGLQGTRKSTAIEMLAGAKYFAEGEDDVTKKDFKQLLQGRLIVEIGELSSFSKADTNHIKKVVSCKEDKFRLPYRRVVEDFPRTCIFIGSTNDSEYLRDATGNRRFWPVAITECDTIKLKEIRLQLFAEARDRVKSGESWWEVPESAIDVQNDRMMVDPWYEDIEYYVRGLNNISTTDIAVKKLQIELKDIDQRIKNRIASIMKMLGFESRVSKDAVSRKSIRNWNRVSTVTDLFEFSKLKNHAEDLQ